MKEDKLPADLVRRGILAAGVAAPAAALVRPLVAIADCGPTISQTPGPFYTPEAPRRRSLVEDGYRGPLLELSGRVLDTRCSPAPGIEIEFWHCDEHGRYDNRGFTYRGRQLSGDDGKYRLTTIVPGVYPGRTRHVHVRLRHGGRLLLTTQLYFPGEPGNGRDFLFDDSLLMDMPDGDGGALIARFDFTLAPA